MTAISPGGLDSTVVSPTAESSTMAATMKKLSIIVAAMTFVPSAYAENRLGAFTSINGSFLSAEGGGGGSLHANRPAQGSWERFQIVDKKCIGALFCNPLQSGDFVCITTVNNHFVVAENGGGHETNANRDSCGAWETLQIFLLGNTPAGLFPVAGEIPRRGVVRVSLRASDGSWFTAEGGGGGKGEVNANRPAIGDWERFSFLQDALH